MRVVPKVSVVGGAEDCKAFCTALWLPKFTWTNASKSSLCNCLFPVAPLSPHFKTVLMCWYTLYNAATTVIIASPRWIRRRYLKIRTRYIGPNMKFSPARSPHCGGFSANLVANDFKLLKRIGCKKRNSNGSRRQICSVGIFYKVS